MGRGPSTLAFEALGGQEEKVGVSVMGLQASAATAQGDPVSLTVEPGTITIWPSDEAEGSGEPSVPPQIQPVSDGEIAEGHTLQVTISVLPGDSSALVLTADLDALPADADAKLEQIDSTTWRLSWTPGYEDAGTYPVSFHAYDKDAPNLADDENATITVTNQNRPPIAASLPDRATVSGETVELDGSGSSDPDGDTLTFAWVFASKPPSSQAVLRSYSDGRATFVPDTPGIYEVVLNVSDGEATSTPSEVSITVSDEINPGWCSGGGSRRSSLAAALLYGLAMVFLMVGERGRAWLSYR